MISWKVNFFILAAILFVANYKGSSNYNSSRRKSSSSSSNKCQSHTKQVVKIEAELEVDKVTCPDESKEILHKRTQLVCGRETRLLKKMDTDSGRLGHSGSTFFEFAMGSIESACFNKMKLGGAWKGWGFDGARAVCMDKFVGNENNNDCIVYSFEAEEEDLFEADMINMGCTVYAYNSGDKTESTWNKVSKSGSGKYQNRNPNGEKVFDFQDELKKNGHENKKISYLKVTIKEGGIRVNEDWLSSKNLKNVEQVSIELTEVPKKFNESVRILKKLHDAGFKIFYMEPHLQTQPYDDVSVFHPPRIEVAMVKAESVC